MTTDAEHAVVLRRTVHLFSPTMPDKVVAATMRSIELLETAEAEVEQISDEYENLREQYVTVCRDLIAAHQAAMDARRIADALGYALTNAESDSNGDPVGPELDPAIAAWHQRSWGVKT